MGPKEAKALWKKVLELDPDNVEAQVNLRRLDGATQGWPDTGED